MTRAITFDVGQTLLELDTAMLARRLGERDVRVTADALEAALPAAWRAHERAVAGGAKHPWKILMRTIVEGAGVSAPDPLVDWLWDEQPRANLWRRPVRGMRELVESLHGRAPLAIVSNSEGKLAELLEELGWARWFAAIADSGRIGIAKPDPGIFAWTLARLGVDARDVIHVGDSREADVEGALAAGCHAIWYGPAVHDLGDERVTACVDAESVGRTLRAWIE